jgi:glycine C-acetyltransferase
MLRTMPQLRDKLWSNVKMLQNGLREIGLELGATDSCVTPVYLTGTTNQAAQLIYELREVHNIFCSVVLYPVIPKGQIMLRLIPTAAHTEEDITLTLDAFRSIYTKLITGQYDSDDTAGMEKMMATIASKA